MGEEVISRQENVIKREIEEELKESFLDYAMSVIVSRALPDVRDGLKPVHRRILYAMFEMGNFHNKPYKKSARIVGDVMGKYHPHGDSAIYETMVRMAQDFSLRYPLIDGQGNWGCFTGDTKVKLTDRRDLSFKELVKEHNEGKTNYTYSINKKGEVEIAKIENPRLTKKNAEIIKITLDNREDIRCTPNHKFMLKSGNYKEAQNITKKDSLMPLNIIKEAEVYNHRIIDIEILEEKEDVYDLTIEDTHNFALSSEVFVHNSVDGDPAAAMRYSEARLVKLAEEILEDLNKETVDFVPNYNEELTEPVVLPSKIPNLLINGSSGIAVGMATNIPPHNLNEVCDGMIHLINNPEAEIKELMNIIKGPDFPTYGMICGRNGIIRSYLSGKGKVVIKSKHKIEERGDKKDIIFTEIPYQVNKAQLLEEIALLVKSERVNDISDIRDESNKEGMRVVISLKKNANEDVVLNQLFKFSRLKSSFGTNMVVLVNGEPRTLNLKEILVEFIKHRKEVVTRRTQYDLRQAKEREHKLEGLVIALNNIDDVVALIKSSKSGEEAVKGLMKNYSLSEIQSKNILDMKLQRLTGLEQAKLRSELEEVKKLITELDIILSDDKNILQVIKNETIEMKEKYGDERRTKILDEEGEIEVEDLIEEEKMVVTLTKDGYVKRVPLSIYKTQNRGGKGVIATGTKDEDFVKDVFVASTHDNILCFTKKGVVHWLKVYNVPQGSRQSKGKAIVNLLNLSDDSPSALVPLTSFESNKYLLFATEKGGVKKTKLELYSRPRKGGIIAITLDNDDKLVDVMVTDGSHDLLLATLKGAAIRFSESEVRPTGRAASGVRGIRLRKDDKLVSAVYLDKEQDILTVTTKGYGKRTPSTDYRTIGRSGKGVRNIKTTPKNGDVVSVLGVDEKEGVMLISKNGIIIRMEISKISQIGRNTQGVRLMNLESEDSVVAAAKVLNEEIDLNGDNNVNKDNNLNREEINQGGDMEKNKNSKKEYTEDEPENTSEELEDEVENDEIDSEEEGVVKGYLKDEFKTMKKGSKADEDDESDEDEEESDDEEEEF